jgi:hypothetical protein
MRAADGKPGMHAFAFKSAFGKSGIRQIGIGKPALTKRALGKPGLFDIVPPAGER